MPTHTHTHTHTQQKEKGELILCIVKWVVIFISGRIIRRDIKEKPPETSNAYVLCKFPVSVVFVCDIWLSSLEKRFRSLCSDEDLLVSAMAQILAMCKGCFAR